MKNLNLLQIRATNRALADALKASPFKHSLCAEVLTMKAAFRRDDSAAALGFDCLCQHIQWGRLPGAPKGTNAYYYCREALRDLCALTHNFSGFVLA